jgi:hypothetical protein
VPFRHPDRSADLGARIEFEVRERLEEALDYVCLDALVRDRKARGLPAPAADSAADRRAYADNVLAFLGQLRRELTEGLSTEEQRKAAVAAEIHGDEQARLIAVQVALARLRPDYWQRFEASCERFLSRIPPATAGDSRDAGTAVPSRRESRSLLSRLFGRG